MRESVFGKIYQLMPIVLKLRKIAQKEQRLVTLKSISVQRNLLTLSIIFVPIRPNRSTSESEELEEMEEER